MRPIIKKVLIFSILYSLFTFSFLLVSAQAVQNEEQPFWLNEKISEDNRLPMHASYVVYSNEDTIQNSDWKDSRNYLNLNGTWKFKWFEKPADLPDNFSSASFNDAGWDNFKVPANWEVNNYGFPIYVNVGYEFQNLQSINPPVVPLFYDPTGIYRREIEIPQNWIGKNLVLHIGAAKSNLMVWVNGKYIGYSEDGKLPCEFDLSSALVPGKNLIVMRIMRWCDGTYLEGQDFWRFSGITRDCYVIMREKTHIEDYRVKTLFEDNYKKANLDLTVELSNKAKAKIVAKLMDGSQLISTNEMILNSESEKSIAIPVEL